MCPAAAWSPVTGSNRLCRAADVIRPPPAVLMAPPSAAAGSVFAAPPLSRYSISAVSIGTGSALVDQPVVLLLLVAAGRQVPLAQALVQLGHGEGVDAGVLAAPVVVAADALGAGLRAGRADLG